MYDMSGSFVLRSIQLKRGEVATALSDYPAALAAYETVLRLAAADEAKVDAPARLGTRRSAQIQALNGLCYVYGMRNEYPRTREIIRQALALAADSPRLLARLVGSDPGLFAADVMVIADAGNVELGTPTVTTSLRGTGSVLVTVRTMAGPAHSGMYGGAAPDALAALVAILATLRDDAGDTTVAGLDNTGTWPGAAYPAERFADDAQVLPGVHLLGSGSVADTVWARPAATVLAIDAPSVANATAAIQHEARAVVNLRVPPGQDAAQAQRLLVAHLEAAAPWGAHVTVEPKTLGQPFAASARGRGYAALASAMRSAFGRDLVEAGQGGAIPLCNALQTAHPGAEILLIGVEEPACHIHAADESVDPGELARTAEGVALMLAELGG
jgi:acetylornithine deacetylase/succinyl-diaminopimelate desuccinylase-like protein